MNKKIFIVLVCVALVLLAGVLFFLKQKGEQQTDTTPSNTGTQFPDAGLNGGGGDDDGLSVPAISGSSIRVKDVRSNPEVILSEGPYHKDYEFGREKENMNFTYQLFYSDIDRNFTIILQDLPLSVVRKAGEQALMDQLEITQEEACRLPVYVGTTNKWSEDYAGMNLGLSFCPGSVEIP